MTNMAQKSPGSLGSLRYSILCLEVKSFLLTFSNGQMDRHVYNIDMHNIIIIIYATMTTLYYVQWASPLYGCMAATDECYGLSLCV